MQEPGSGGYITTREVHREIPKDLLARFRPFPKDSKIATRKAGSDVLQPIAEAMPLLIGGAPIFYGSTLNYIQSDKDFNPENRGGRNIRFGIREHGMCAILNGIAYHGIFRAVRSYVSWFSPIIAGLQFVWRLSRSCP